MKKVFILGASMLQVPAIRKAKEKGLYVYVLDYDPEAVGIPYADEFLCISTIDREAVLKAAQQYRPDYIITSTSDMPKRGRAGYSPLSSLRTTSTEVPLVIPSSGPSASPGCPPKGPRSGTAP